MEQVTQATEIYYDPDPKTTIIEEDQEWVEGYFDLNEVGDIGGFSHILFVLAIAAPCRLVAH